jgi:outer membrane lipoprotein-sorting protein
MNKLITGCLVAAAVASVAGCGKAPSAKQVLDNSAAAYQSVKSITIDGDNGVEVRQGGQFQSRGSEISIKYQKPSKLRQDMPGGQPTIIIDGKKGYVYFKTPQNNYIEGPGDMIFKNLTSGQSAASMLTLLNSKNPFEGAKSPKLLSSEQVNGVDTYVVEFEPGNKPAMPGLEKAKIIERDWIGKSDWLVRKREIVAEVPKEVMSQQTPPGAPPTEGATFTFSAEVRKLEANGSIDAAQFAPPKDAKRINPQQMAPPPGAAGPRPARPGGPPPQR